jgi:hypothetical protein
MQEKRINNVVLITFCELLITFGVFILLTSYQQCLHMSIFFISFVKHIN